MRRYAIIVVVLFSALLWVSLATAQSAQTEPMPYVYRIDSKGCKFEPTNRRQTGFRVAGLTGIVTALHGVADCKTISAVTDSDQELYTDLEIEQVDIAHDVALLGSPELDDWPADGLVAVSLSTTEILTSTLRVVGYPLGLDKQDTDVIESIRAIESLDDVIPDAEEPTDFIKRKSPSLTINVLNLQAQLLPGHSGAPMIDPNDQLIAVGNGGLRGGTVGRSWAIPWQDVDLRAVDDVKPQLDALAAKDLAGLAFSSTYPGRVDTTTASATYTVQLIDSRQNQPIANAEVLLTHSAGYEIGVTDSKGFHTFHLSNDNGIDYGESQLQVEAAGYESYSRDLPNVLERVSPEKLRLTALRPTATVPATSTPTVASSQLCAFAFLVLDAESDETIGKAKIALFVGAKQETGATDSTGFYLAKLPCSNVQDVEARVRVSANGYTVYSRSVFLSNETTEILLERKVTFAPLPTRTPTLQPTSTKEPTSTPTPAPTVCGAEVMSTTGSTSVPVYDLPQKGAPIPNISLAVGTKVTINYKGTERYQIAWIVNGMRFLTWVPVENLYFQKPCTN